MLPDLTRFRGPWTDFLRLIPDIDSFQPVFDDQFRVFQLFRWIPFPCPASPSGHFQRPEAGG